MAAFLSDEWFASLAADDVGLSDCKVDVTITGAPGGDARWHVDVVGAHLTAASGTAPRAAVALTLSYDDSVAILRGELEASVAFMQGKMKTAGDPGQLLDVLAATARPGFRTARDELAAATEL
ncbi:MAG: SCP2 sterol-binding domain-containing protein [Acidimicrobiia bacterium]